MASSRRVQTIADDLKNIEFETSEDVEITPTFDGMGLREDLVRGIYAYGEWCTRILGMWPTSDTRFTCVCVESVDTGTFLLTFENFKALFIAVFDPSLFVAAEIGIKIFVSCRQLWGGPRGEVLEFCDGVSHC